jgi:hypothetical protein
LPRRAFYSFHYGADSWRAGKVRNMGVVEGLEPISDNDWETVKRGGDRAIRNWIDRQLKGRSCTIVLIGEHTAGRPWINYEIEKSWSMGKGLLGIRINRLTDQDNCKSWKGANPFRCVRVGGRKLSRIVKVHTPNGIRSKTVYGNIRGSIAGWVEDAIAAGKNYP